MFLVPRVVLHDAGDAFRMVGGFLLIAAGVFLDGASAK